MVGIWHVRIVSSIHSAELHKAAHMCNMFGRPCHLDLTSDSSLETKAACNLQITHQVPLKLVFIVCRHGYRSDDQKPWEDRTQPLVRLIPALLQITCCRLEDITLGIAWQSQPIIRPEVP